MSIVKRYRPALDDYSRDPWMKESELGGYVEYSDYEKLEKELSKLKEMKFKHGSVKSAIIEGHELGLSAVEIIEKYGVNEKSVYITAKNLGIKLESSVKKRRIKKNG